MNKYRDGLWITFHIVAYLTSWMFILILMDPWIVSSQYGKYIWEIRLVYLMVHSLVYIVCVVVCYLMITLWKVAKDWIDLYNDTEREFWESHHAS